MEEKNEFIVAVGTIDTTDEHPSVAVAFVSIDNQLIQLEFIEKTKTGDKTSVAYFGNGFTLLITYPIPQEIDRTIIFKNAHVTISKKKRRSEYEVFSKQGYL
ncbi:MAG: hypothetical protein ABI581_08650 [Sediminibacterium sp.]